MKKLFLFLIIGGFIQVPSFSQIADGSFEAGTGAGFWTETSTNWGFIICSNATCGNGIAAYSAHTGSYWAWFGATEDSIETGTIEQSIVIPAGTIASIDMFIFMAQGGPGIVEDKLIFIVDGIALDSITALDSAFFQVYSDYSVDVSSFADGSNHLFRMEGYQSTTTEWSTLVDDVSLTVDGISVGIFNDLSEESINAYPNPFEEILRLDFNSNRDETVAVNIVDAMGRKIFTKVGYARDEWQFDTDNISTGLYFVEVWKGNEVSRLKVIKK